MFPIRKIAKQRQKKSRSKQMIPPEVYQTRRSLSSEQSRRHLKDLPFIKTDSSQFCVPTRAPFAPSSVFARPSRKCSPSSIASQQYLQAGPLTQSIIDQRRNVGTLPKEYSRNTSIPPTAPPSRIVTPNYNPYSESINNHIDVVEQAKELQIKVNDLAFSCRVTIDKSQRPPKGKTPFERT